MSARRLMLLFTQYAASYPRWKRVGVLALLAVSILRYTPIEAAARQEPSYYRLLFSRLAVLRLPLQTVRSPFRGATGSPPGQHR